MSLRTEIRVAIDEVAPPAPHLEREVLAAIREVQRPSIGRRRDRKPARVLRVSLSLVAAAVLIALLGGLMVGGRLWVERNTPATTPHVINQTQLKRFESRPLQLPVMQPGGACQEGPVHTSDNWSVPPITYGSGPVYAVRGMRSNDAWGTWAAVQYYIDPGYSGPMLIRGRDLSTGQQIVFTVDPPEAGTAAGKLAGTPTGSAVGTRYDPVWHVTVKVYSELVVVAGQKSDVPGAWPIARGIVGVPKAASGCVGFQVEGADFTEVYVVNETA